MSITTHIDKFNLLPISFSYIGTSTHITISLFEAIETSNEIMVMKLQILLDRSYGFRIKIIVYINDDSSANLGPMTTPLKLVN